MTAGTPAQQAWDRMGRRCQDLLAEACDRLRGADAAAVYSDPMWGPDGVEALGWRWKLGDDVRVIVEDVPLRLSDVPALVETGVEVDDIKAPADVYGYYVAAAIDRARGSVVTVLDWRGLWRLADSMARAVGRLVDEPHQLGRTQGSVARSWLARSGVPAANARRSRTVAELCRQYGKSDGQAAAKAIYVKAIADDYLAMPPGAMSTFAVWQGDRLLVSAQRPDGYKFPKFADHILAALSEVAWGGRRGPRAGDQSEDVLDQPRISITHATAPIGGIHRTRPVGVGDWTRRAAAGVITETEAAFTMLDSSVDYVIARYRERGLSPRQAEVLAWTEAGLGGREVAHRLGIDESTVSRTLKRARNRLKTA